METKTKCLIDGCTRAAVSRGLCHACYSVARGTILRNETSWEELENLGLARHFTMGRAPAAGAFAIALANAKNMKG